MNYSIIRFILGRMLRIEGLVLLVPALVSLVYQEHSGLTFVLTSALLIALSLLLGKRPKNMVFYAKEGFVIVALAWILWSAFGALPFVLSGSIPHFVDAFFETVSGFTTTGSTILQDIEVLPKGINFWRCLTHWIGGMGVLVFVMAVIPLGNKGAMFLMRAEMPGPTCDKLVPKSRGTAKILYCMYLFLSGVEVLLLLAGGMDLYNAVIHTFSTAGTGGFSSMNASVAAFDSAYIDGVITVFMLLFGINFNLYYLLLLKNVRAVMKSEELRAYLGIVAGAIALITLNILHLYETPLRALRYAAFQVASIITTTGFVTANYELWPELSKTVILLLMIIGACAGSTGGGMKVSRILILSKTIGKEVRQILHPKSVNVVKMDGKRVPGESIHGVYVYLICYLVILCGSVLLVSVDNQDFTTNFTAVLTTLNNVGPGLAKVGPIENFFHFSYFSKLVLSMDMLVGRLEILPMLMLFAPQVWRKKF
ncbi:MAG: TrkH family potassium uptake protein [Lachnospiraceae bacterium]|jgi:trk system potassium uptake protein TrkH|uniref:TrkH family potassium uptake protein n=1 Tax=Candidatus Merdisoma sp. JLR.KK011 TaxID=3114299 RepID=UPI0014345EDB|nr:TrkH family potassium uptake protein [Lachnospiraceae bacterium]MCI9479230.1 TrkH family potassium uptake protein [Lachnospiraceae bacterium]MCI9623786.1 TrkH family potassium uptake protein [Lachnospiraceae bacterium]GFI11172.1 Trk system potassium uptake protein TrkH [Lachnospiraceae bacterium]